MCWERENHAVSSHTLPHKQKNICVNCKLRPQILRWCQEKNRNKQFSMWQIGCYVCELPWWASWRCLGEGYSIPWTEGSTGGRKDKALKHTYWHWELVWKRVTGKWAPIRNPRGGRRNEKVPKEPRCNRIPSSATEVCWVSAASWTYCSLCSCKTCLMLSHLRAWSKILPPWHAVR